MENNNPYISFVIVARNDDYGGNFLHRMRIFVSTLLELCEKYSLSSELIIVDWNPPISKEPLYQVISWQPNRRTSKIRFIEVSPEVHRRLPNSDKMPIFEFLGKNVGVRRARGKYVLVTNPDIIFNEDLISFLSSRKLSENFFYRIDRHDISNQVPSSENIKDIFEFCEKNWEKVHTTEGSLNRKFPYIDFLYLRSILAIIRNKITGNLDTKIHTNASGDFFLMANSQWQRLRGYPELPIPSFIDSYMCFIAAISGLSQVVLNRKKRIYHQGHSSNINRADLYKEYQTYKDRVKEMIRSKQPFIMNNKNWGLGKESLKEYGN